MAMAIATTSNKRKWQYNVFDSILPFVVHFSLVVTMTSIDLASGDTFYPRDAMLARSLRQRRVRPSVRPDVRPSHAGIVPSRAKAGS